METEFDILIFTGVFIMAKKKAAKHAVPDNYTVQVRKADKIVDGVMMGVSLFISALVLHMVIDSVIHGDDMFRIVIGIISVPFVLYLGAWHYPRYLFDWIEVHGDMITFHQLYFRKHTINFKDIAEIYTAGKDKDKLSSGYNGSNAIIIDYGKGKFRLPCKFCDDWQILKNDLKQRGIAIK